MNSNIVVLAHFAGKTFFVKPLRDDTFSFALVTDSTSERIEPITHDEVIEALPAFEPAFRHLGPIYYEMDRHTLYPISGGKILNYDEATHGWTATPSGAVPVGRITATLAKIV